jgi:hypothetical protein
MYSAKLPCRRVVEGSTKIKLLALLFSLIILLFCGTFFFREMGIDNFKKVPFSHQAAVNIEFF